MIVRQGVGNVEAGDLMRLFPWVLGGLVLFSLWNATRRRR